MKPDMMERTRAAAGYITTARTPEQEEKLKLAAFMAIFHPNKELPR